MTFACAAMVSLLVSAPPGAGAPAHPKGYVCRRAAEPIVVDGKLGDASWADAPWTDTFVDIEGDKKPKPRFKTRAKMLWDDQYLYIAADMEEPHVWGTLTKHDSVIFQDNDFEVFIDPDSDNQNYGELEINALNTEWDLFLPKAYRDGGPALNSWEIPGLKKGVNVRGTLNDPKDTDEGWSVEMAIPWSVWREHTKQALPPREGDQWRINFSRVEWHHELVDDKYRKVPNTKEDNWVWSPQEAVDMHRPETWGYLQFTGKSGNVPFRPDPTLAARNLLMKIYWAQKPYHGEHKNWAETLKDLKIELPEGVPAPTIRLTKDGYEATIPLAAEIGGPLTISQDSRFGSGIAK
ncbi:carbohydrate-binding family 9-like protein [Isosphaeraceae bacterium EP7]